MTGEQILLAVSTAVALVAVVVAVLALRAARLALAAAPGPAVEQPQPTSAEGVVERSPITHETEERSYVITDAGRQPADEVAHVAVPDRIDGRLFADIVARETLVKAVSWGHGLRRALAPDVRNRIRFEVRQQGRRARKDRKAEMREALREYRARRAEDNSLDETPDSTEDAA